MYRHMWKNNKFGLRIYYKGIVKKQNEVERMLYEFLKGTMQVNQFTIYDCINATDQWLESTHNYIQWCFPNHKQSSVIKNAPILTDNELNKILNDEICVSNIKSMTNRMIQFYDNNPVKSSFNHNCKRITRILLFLKEIDENECERFYRNTAERFILQYRKTALRMIGINDHTISYWTSALLHI